MKQVTAACAEAVRLGNATFAITGTITLSNASTVQVNNSTIVDGSLEITTKAVDGDELTFGGAFLGELSINIYSNVNRYLFYGATMTLDCFITYKSQSQTVSETVDFGVWNIAEAKRDKSVVSITAYDNMSLLDEEFTTEVTGTAYTLMSSFATAYGFELAEDEEYYENLPNGEEYTTLNKDTGCSTIRQCAAAIAQSVGCFLMADGLGKISLRQFGEEPSMSLGFSHRYSAVIADYDCNYIALKITSSAGEYEAITTQLGATGLVMLMENAPAWSIGVDDTFERMTQALFDYLEPIVYTPCEASIFCNPLLEIGDRVKLYTDSNNTEAQAVETLITEYTWSYNRQSDLSSVGANKYLIGSTDSATERMLQRVEAQIAEEQLIYYAFRNTGNIQINSSWTTVASVNFVSSKDTHAVFNGTFQVNVTISDIDTATTFTIYDAQQQPQVITVHDTKLGLGKLHVRYLFNEIAYDREYTADLTKGGHIITLYQPIANVTKSQVNKFAVQMKLGDSDSSMVVPDMSFIGSITGQGLAETVYWDGGLLVEDDIPCVDITDDTPSVPQPAADTVTVVLSDDNSPITVENSCAYITEPVSLITIMPCEDEITIAAVAVSVSRSYLYPSEWVYNSNYIVFNNTIEMKTNWTFTSTEQVIDSGKMTSVQIVNNDKQSVESVVITSE